MLALAGMSRLLRAHLRTLLAVVPRFQDGWEELMLVVESSMAGGRHETAVAAVALLSNVLQVTVQCCTCVTCLRAVSASKGWSCPPENGLEVCVAVHDRQCAAPQAHAATDAVSRAMWKRALRALGVGVEAGVSPQCRVPLQVGRAARTWTQLALKSRASWICSRDSCQRQL